MFICPQAYRTIAFTKSISSRLATTTALTLCLVFTHFCCGQDAPYPTQLVSARFHSVKLHPTGNPTAHPFIPLQSGQLSLSFDDFSNEFRPLELRWKHCTFDWYDSPDLMPSDYISGFSSASFQTIENSFNTKTPYTHYAVTFPNDMMQFTKSGNYIAEVIEAGHPERALIQLRFVVYESLIDIQMNVHESSIIRDKRTHQEVDLALMHSIDRYVIQDAYDALQTVLVQNGKWETAIEGLEPQFVRGEEITFNPTGSESFAGGNNWRFADLKSLRFASLGIERIIDEGDRWHVYLEPDEPRPYAFLKTQPDIDGHYVIANELQDDDTGSDYVWTHFALLAPEERMHEDVFIYGELSNWSYPESHRMLWNEDARRYETELFLKQGYYNYEYRIRPALDRGRNDVMTLRQSPSNIAAIEGSHALADTPYMCFAYYWDMNGYDRVIGYAMAKQGDRP